MGGGKKQMMKKEKVGDMMDGIEQYWYVEKEIEMKMEENKKRVEEESFRGYSEEGVKRVQIGIKELKDKDMRRIGRMNQVEEEKEEIRMEREILKRI